MFSDIGCKALKNIFSKRSLYRVNNIFNFIINKLIIQIACSTTLLGDSKMKDWICYILTFINIIFLYNSIYNFIFFGNIEAIVNLFLNIYRHLQWIFNFYKIMYNNELFICILSLLLINDVMDHSLLILIKTSDQNNYYLTFGN